MHDLLLKYYFEARRLLRYEPPRPSITAECGPLKPSPSKPLFIVVCGPLFDMAVPNAGMTSRMGWCRGFESLGIPYLLLSVYDLARRLPEYPHAICWIAGSDYAFLDKAGRAALRRTKHIVWVNTWFENDKRYYRQNDYPNNSLSSRLNNLILSTEPTFCFTISPELAFDFYATWLARGVRLVSLPLACDTALYSDTVPHVPAFDGVRMAFVGGYWAYKSRQFDRYLKPYQDILTVYGYSAWPYAGYGGTIPASQEPSLYRQALLSPSINEPHVERMGIDVNERVFKVLGSGGMTVTDQTPAYRAWFTDEELCVPRDIEEYRAMVHQALTDRNFNDRYRKAGRAAVLQRHTYVHRAQEVLRLLQVPGTTP